MNKIIANKIEDNLKDLDYISEDKRWIFFVIGAIAWASNNVIKFLRDSGYEIHLNIKGVTVDLQPSQSK